jgi:DNA-directed RNA polymerase subunit beta'
MFNSSSGNTQFFTNKVIDKKQLKTLISWTFSNLGVTRSTFLADQIKDLGFHYATQAGISISIEDLKIPKNKRRLVSTAQEEIKAAEFEHCRGEITSVERFQKVIDTWNVTSESIKDEIVDYFREKDPLNSIYMMAFSGARGNISQVRQLIGMRGLMSDPQGEIIDIPIKSNFKEGLTLTEYIISSYGARKGLVDTALRTADSGYLTRRLVDVAQEVIIREVDCQTLDGLSIFLSSNSVFLENTLLGRACLNDIFDPSNGSLVFARNTLFTHVSIQDLINLGLQKVKIRSPLTCLSRHSICQLCYGWSLGYEKLVNLGEAVGIIAAQSIGEPGTQLTMRTFHTGGVFTSEVKNQIRNPFSSLFSTLHRGDSIFNNSRTRHGKESRVFETSSFLSLVDIESNIFKKWTPSNTRIFVHDNEVIRSNQVIAEAIVQQNLNTERVTKDIVSDLSGEVFFDDLTIEEQIDRQGNTTLLNQKNGLIWVLSGHLLSIPNPATLVVEKGIFIDTHTVLAKNQIFNEYNGKVRLSRDNLLQIDIIVSSTILENISVLKSNIENKPFLLSLGNNKEFILNTSSSISRLVDSQIIGESIDPQFCTNTGGIIKFLDLHVAKRSKNSEGFLVSNDGGSILWIPEEVHEINKDLSLLLVEEQTFISENTEILKGVFSKSNGLVQIVQQNNIILEVIIKPGLFYKVEDLERGLEVDQLILEPGELLFNKIFLEELSFIELLDTLEGPFVLVRPVQRFDIPPIELENNSNYLEINEWLALDIIRRIPFKDGERIKSVDSVQLLKSQLVLRSRTIGNLAIDIELIPTFNDCCNLSFIVLETLKLSQEILLDDINLSKKLEVLVEDGSFVQSASVVAEVLLFSKSCGQVLALKNKNLTNQQILISKITDSSKFFVGPESETLVPGYFFRSGDKLTANFYVPFSCQILSVEDDFVFLRPARPYLVSGSSILHVNHQDFIRMGDRIASLIFERVKTGDIVQGLPRIEEILEARRPKDSCILSGLSGLVSINSTVKGVVIQVSSSSDTLEYLLTYGQGIAVQNNSFVSVGDPLTDGIINPHDLLSIVFSYYKKTLPLPESTKRSVKSLQLFLIREVQKVYSSQNVEISDKHVEVIVRQMTLKARIEEGHDSILLPGELVELFEVEQINQILLNNSQEPATYYPVLLGITKASLSTESFISAASFQETTRVLTDAAIQGKTDWLRGLKENVIIGRLIPAGTGFNL